MRTSTGELKLISIVFLLMVIAPMAQAENNEKVVVIGLDGASEDFMQRCMEKNDLPNIEKLSSTSFQRMDSTLPPLTPSGMSSFLTGKNPGGHGVYGFEKRDALSYDTSTVNSRNLDSTLPESINGSSVLINVPMTYPAPKINGVVVSGFPGSTSGKYVHPSILKKDLEDRNYTVTTAGSFEEREELEEEVFEAFETRRKLSLDYMEKHDWKFFMTMFTGDARLMHFSEPECERAIGEYYKELDSFVGKVQERTDENTTVVLMSNHGFTELDKKMYLYTFLKDNGYLTPKQPDYWKHRLQDFAGDIMDFLGLSEGGEVSGRASFSSAYMDEINWDKTKAYTGGFYNGQIFINLEGREPNGIVKEENYEEVRQNIIDDLKQLEDPETGEKVVENIYKKEELYSGEKMDEVPDIVIETPGYNHIARFGFGKTFLNDPTEQSSPVKEGFMMSNRELKQENASIVDLSSSIGNLLGEDFGEGENVFK